MRNSGTDSIVWMKEERGYFIRARYPWEDSQGIFIFMENISVV